MTMKTTIQTRLGTAMCLAYAATILCSLQPLAARAAEESPPTQRVSFADLDISKPAGAQTLYRRIKAAARQVCQPSVASQRGMSVMEQRCIKQAVDNAVKNVNSAALTDIHAGVVPRLARR
jgi:UrcA family protein